MFAHEYVYELLTSSLSSPESSSEGGSRDLEGAFLRGDTRPEGVEDLKGVEDLDGVSFFEVLDFFEVFSSVSSASAPLRRGDTLLLLELGVGLCVLLPFPPLKKSVILREDDEAAACFFLRSARESFPIALHCRTALSKRYQARWVETRALFRL